jgi:hypothetical protein
MATKWTDVVSALAAVVLPLAIFVASNELQAQQIATEVESRTLIEMKELDREINKILNRKRELDKTNEVGASENQKADYVLGDDGVRNEVVSLLDEYEHICYGANEDLYSSKIVKGMRGDWLVRTFEIYREFIDRYKAEDKTQLNAWIECDKWIKANA